MDGFYFKLVSTGQTNHFPQTRTILHLHTHHSEWETIFFSDCKLKLIYQMGESYPDSKINPDHTLALYLFSSGSQLQFHVCSNVGCYCHIWTKSSAQTQKCSTCRSILAVNNQTVPKCKRMWTRIRPGFFVACAFVMLL